MAQPAGPPAVEDRVRSSSALLRALPPLARDPSRRPIWTDRWALGILALGLLVNGALALVLWRRFEGFPELIALHYNAFGEADIIGGKGEIYKLPLIGAVIWAANAALAVVASPHDRVLARTTLGVALLVQVLICAGAWRVLT